MDLTIGYYVVKYGFFLVGAVLILLSVFVRQSEKRKYQNCTLALKGTVSDVIRRSDLPKSGASLRKADWYPEFTCERNGKTQVIHSACGRKRNHFKVGQPVELWVNPENIQEYRCTEEKSESTVHILIAAGVGALMIGAVISYILQA